MRFVKNNSVMKSSIIVATLAFLLTMSGCFGSHFEGIVVDPSNRFLEART